MPLVSGQSWQWWVAFSWLFVDELRVGSGVVLLIIVIKTPRFISSDIVEFSIWPNAKDRIIEKYKIKYWIFFINLLYEPSDLKHFSANSILYISIRCAVIQNAWIKLYALIRFYQVNWPSRNVPGIIWRSSFGYNRCSARVTSAQSCGLRQMIPDSIDSILKKWVDIKVIWSLFMVPEILISYDQPFSTKRFWLNQSLDHLETSRADLYWAKLSFYEN